MIPDLFEGVDPVAQSAIRAYCGWHVAPSLTETITLDGPGSGSTLFLPSLYVTTVASVSIDGRPVADPEWSQSGLIRGAFGIRFRSVVVTFTHGYDELPYELHAAAGSLARNALAGSNVRIGGVSLTVPGGTPSTLADSTGDSYVDRVLAPFRIGLRP